MSLPISSRLADRSSRVPSSAIRDLLIDSSRPGVLSLAGGLPATETFPVQDLRDAAIELFDRYPDTALQYGPTQGHLPLQEFAASRMGCANDDVLITTGSQQALSLLGWALVNPGDIVAFEQPGYMGAAQAFAAAGATFAGIPVDRAGLNVEHFASMLAHGLRPKLVYCVPNFQNPTGAQLSMDRRILLASLAREYDFLIIEDDPYGMLAFDASSQLPSLAHATGHERSPQVIQLQSTSKILVPALRVGWLCAPPALMEALVRAKQAADLHTSSLTQHLAATLLTQPGWLDHHIESIRPVYAARATALIEALVDEFTAHSIEFTLTRPVGGMFTWATVPQAYPTVDFARCALAHNVAVVPGSAFYNTPSDGLAEFRMSYATLPPDQLRVAAVRLIESIVDVQS